MHILKKDGIIISSDFHNAREQEKKIKRREILIELPMRVALGQFNRLDDEERLLFIKQLGVDDIILNTPALGIFRPSRLAY